MGRRSSGFTLVEVMVALLVLALMAGMAWQGVDGIVRTREVSQRQLEQTLRINTVLAQWEKDLAAVQDTSVVPALAFDGATLRLTRRAEGGVQLVAWSVQPSPGGSPWRRWAGPVVTASGALQDSWIASRQLQGDEPGQLRALEGITQWQLYCLPSPRAGGIGMQWANMQTQGCAPDSAPPPATAASALPPAQVLPIGVRLVLEFAPGSGVSGTLLRDLPLLP